VNIDFDRKIKPDKVMDIRKGLAFPEYSVDFIHSEDFIEHLTLQDGIHFVKECHRVLKSGGVMRVLTPDLQIFARQYVNRDPNALNWYNQNLGCKTFCEMFNMGMRMGGHTFLYDEELLTVILNEAGFHIEKSEYRKSKFPVLRDLDLRQGMSLSYDCVK
jgi:predicted SAM-dependent methyltransferase